MALKFQIDNLDGLDESVSTLYEKHDDGKFYLAVDGAVAKGKLDEFRNNNVDLLKKLETFEKRFGDLDPDKYVEMQTTLQQIEEDKNKNKTVAREKVEQMIEERTATMREEHATLLKTATDLNVVQGRQLETLVVDGAVRDAAVKAKVIDTAIDDVVLRAKSTFRVVEGAAIPHDAEGQIVYGKDGTNPMTPGEWVGNLQKTASHLFVQSTGAGTHNSSNPNTAGMDPSKMSPMQKIRAGMDDS